MNKYSKTLAALLALSLFVSSANADVLGVAKKHPILTAVGVASVGLYLQSATHIASKLSQNPEEANDFFASHPDKVGPVSKYLISKLSKPQSIYSYDKFKKLAEVMGIGEIPPYAGEFSAKPALHDNPIQESDENGALENPIPTDQWSNIIVTPEGKRLDTGTEFPNQEIKSWDEYVFLKAQSKILAENMKAAGMGEKPDGYAAHHIVAWSDGRPIAKDLRLLLSSNGIDINDPSNGVYLPHTTDAKTSNPNEAYHRSIHTDKYYMNVYQRLIDFNGDKTGMEDALAVIGRELKNNSFRY